MSWFASVKNWLIVSPVGKLFLQFVKFGLVGVTNTALAYGIYALVLWRGGQNVWQPKSAATRTASSAY